jgi:homoserine dehydrogenase
MPGGLILKGTDMDAVRVGVIGCGTVGAGVVKMFAKQPALLAQRLGVPVILARIADIDPSRYRQLPVGTAVCSTNAADITGDPEIDIVVELIGGTTAAKDCVLAALNAGKHVVTANKKLLAEYGPEIFDVAEKSNASVYFEASVGGGMPVIKTIRETMVGNDILSITAIINGTCNYILTRMESDGSTFEEALRMAQKAGFAEADPALDVGGGDSGHKTAIMASLMSRGYVPFAKMPVEGISNITAEDIAFARQMGYRIKLLGIIKAGGADGRLDVRVHPAMLRHDHILASVANEFNAVLCEGDAVGRILLYGKGAGQMPTATAVMSDIVDVARNIAGGSAQRIPMGFYSRGHEVALKPIEEITSRYYLRFTVVDKPKVLAPIAAALGDNGISIASVLQKEGASDDRVPVVILTHVVQERGVQKALKEIETMEFVLDKTQLIRIEE